MEVVENFAKKVLNSPSCMYNALMTKTRLQFNLPVLIIREDEAFIAYTPALDLSTVGKTFDEAKKRFEEVVNIFFEEILAKGTVDEALAELGWHKKNHQFSPPVVVEHHIEEFSIPLTPYTP